MPQQTTDLHVNPSDETIRLGPLAVRFLLTGDNSSGSVAAFELVVPAAQRLAAPAHSHDHYEETIYGIDGVLDLDRRRETDRRRAGTGALHSARRHSPVRQQRQPGREGALRDHAGRDRSAVFPRGGRGDQRGGRWTAGPREDGGDHAPPRPHPGSARASGVDARGYGHMSSLEIRRVARFAWQTLQPAGT